MTSSRAMCLGGIFKGLEMANPERLDWATVDEAQVDFLKRYSKGALADLPSLEMYLDGLATSDAAALNCWFAKHGFPGMNVTIPNGGHAVGTIFDLLVDWQVPGKKRDVYARSIGEWFGGVEMRPSQALLAWELSDHEHPIFELQTKQDG